MQSTSFFLWFAMVVLNYLGRIRERHFCLTWDIVYSHPDRLPQKVLVIFIYLFRERMNLPQDNSFSRVLCMGMLAGVELITLIPHQLPLPAPAGLDYTLESSPVVLLLPLFPVLGCCIPPSLHSIQIVLNFCWYPCLEITRYWTAQLMQCVWWQTSNRWVPLKWSPKRNYGFQTAFLWTHLRTL